MVEHIQETVWKNTDKAKTATQIIHAVISVLISDCGLGPYIRIGVVVVQS